MKKHYTKKKLRELIEEYVSSEGIKSIAGLAIFLDVDVKTLKSWEQDTEKGFDKIIEYAKTCIERDLVENGLRGKYNATMSSFILKTSFGYSEKAAAKTDGEVRIEVADELQKFSE